MNRKIYLVDTENVGGQWMRLCSQLQTRDKILLFHTSESMKFTFEDMQYLQPYMKQIHMIHCYNGTPNALDFQLSAVNGYLFTSDKVAEYVVVSNDTGYDRMIWFMRGLGQSITRMGITAGLVTPKCVEHPVEIADCEYVTVSKIKSVLGKKVPMELLQEITDMLNTLHNHPEQIKEKNKYVTVNNRLQKICPNCPGYYKKLKSANILADL